MVVVLTACVFAAALLAGSRSDDRTELAANPPSVAAAAPKTSKPGKVVPDTARSISEEAEAALDDLEGKPASKTVAKAAKAAEVQMAADVKEAALVSPSDSEVHKIMNTMMKADAAKKQDKEDKESKTDRMQDRILRAKDRLASLKLKKSNDFAKYEKEDEEVDDAKSKAQQAHDKYQEDMERERSYKKRLNHLSQKLANHLTGEHARTDLNSYYAQLNDEAIKTIPKKIRDADTISSHEAAHYKHTMEQHHKALAAGVQRRNAAPRAAKMDVRKTVSLKQFPQVNVWDTHPKQDIVDSAEKKLKHLSKAADREILKTEEARAKNLKKR